MARSLQLALLAVLALALSPGACRAQAADPAAAALLAKMVEAFGGETRVRSLKGWRYQGTQTHRSSSGEFVNQLDVLLLLPNQMHVELRNSQGTTTAVYSPVQAFWVSGSQTGDLPAAAQQTFLQDVRANPVNVLQHLADPAYSFRIAGSEVVAGVSTTILEIALPGGQARWYVDPATGWPLKTSNAVPGGSGQAENTREYSDWRWVEGGGVPFRQRYVQRGTDAASNTEGSIEIQSIQLNPPADPRLFARPPLSLSSLAFSPSAVSFTPPAPPPPKKATLRISAQPGRAQVYLDDEPRGTASEEGRLVLKDLTPGAYRLRLTLGEYKDWNQTITLNPGDELTVEARLVPRGPAPFTSQEIVEMLEGGVSTRRAATLVQQTGVDFTLTQDIEDRLRRAGADSDLLLAIAKAKK